MKSRELYRYAVLARQEGETVRKTFFVACECQRHVSQAVTNQGENR